MSAVSIQGWGPFAAVIEPTERMARLRELRVLVRVLGGPVACACELALERAETDPAALEEAALLLEGLPSRSKKNVMATYGAIACSRLGRRVAQERRAGAAAGPA